MSENWVFVCFDSLTLLSNNCNDNKNRVKNGSQFNEAEATNGSSD